MAKLTNEPEKPAAKPVKPAPRRRYRGNTDNSMMVLFVLMILMLAVFRWQVGLLFTVFMLPTFVLGLTGRRDIYRNDRLMCVAFMNIAGVIPFAAQIWQDPAMLDRITTNVVNITVMLGAAAVGYLLLWLCPVIAAMVLQAMAQERIKKLIAQRQSLMDVYGGELLGDK